MIEITPSIKIDDQEIIFSFTRSTGPGGQNVNKVSSAVKLRWDVSATSVLAPEVKQRLLKIAGSRVTEEGVLLIVARRFRSQEQNRRDAITRLVALVQQALEEPKVRRKTRPSRASSAVRVEEKKRRGVIKRIRQNKPEKWEE